MSFFRYSLARLLHSEPIARLFLLVTPVILGIAWLSLTGNAPFIFDSLFSDQEQIRAMTLYAGAMQGLFIAGTARSETKYLPISRRGERIATYVWTLHLPLLLIGILFFTNTLTKSDWMYILYAVILAEIAIKNPAHIAHHFYVGLFLIPNVLGSNFTTVSYHITLSSGLLILAAWVFGTANNARTQMALSRTTVRIVSLAALLVLGLLIQNYADDPINERIPFESTAMLTLMSAAMIVGFATTFDYRIIVRADKLTRRISWHRVQPQSTMDFVRNPLNSLLVGLVCVFVFSWFGGSKEILFWAFSVFWPLATALKTDGTKKDHIVKITIVLLVFLMIPLHIFIGFLLLKSEFELVTSYSLAIQATLGFIALFGFMLWQFSIAKRRYVWT